MFLILNLWGIKATTINIEGIPNCRFILEAVAGEYTEHSVCTGWCPAPASDNYIYTIVKLLKINKVYVGYFAATLRGEFGMHPLPTFHRL